MNELYHGWLCLRLLMGVRQAITPLLSIPVHPDEAVVEDRLWALHSALSLVWRGKLDQSALRVILEGHLSNKHGTVRHL